MLPTVRSDTGDVRTSPISVGGLYTDARKYIVPTTSKLRLLVGSSFGPEKLGDREI